MAPKENGGYIGLKMPTRYCPECKQNVPAEPGVCINCAYEFDVSVDKAELESIFDKVMSVAIKSLCVEPVKPSQLLELGDSVYKFRKKYLEK